MPGGDHTPITDGIDHMPKVMVGLSHLVFAAGLLSLWGSFVLSLSRQIGVGTEKATLKKGFSNYQLRLRFQYKIGLQLLSSVTPAPPSVPGILAEKPIEIRAQVPDSYQGVYS